VRMEGIWLEKHFNIPVNHNLMARAILASQTGELSKKPRFIAICSVCGVESCMCVRHSHSTSSTFGESTSVPSRISFGFPLTLQISFMPKHGHTRSRTYLGLTSEPELSPGRRRRS